MELSLIVSIIYAKVNKTDTEVGPKIPIELAVTSIFFVFTLAADLFQYFSASIVWSIYGRIKELKGTKDDDEFKAPRWINWSANSFFYLKFIFAFIAYSALLKYLYKIIFNK